MTARTQKSWSFSENPGDKSGDQAILEWLQTPHNAARFIRWWNNIAQDDTKTSFSNELGAFVNNNSSPQRTNQSIYKRSERFDELLKDCKDMLSNGVSERVIVKHFPYYYECIKCMESGIEVIRQELDASGEEDEYYDKIFAMYQSHYTQLDRAERRSKTTLPPETPSSALSSRNVLSETPSMTTTSSTSMSKQPSMVSASLSNVAPPSPSFDPVPSSSNSKRASFNLHSDTSPSPPRPSKRGFCIISDSITPSSHSQPSLSSLSSFSHPSPTSPSHPISTTRTPPQPDISSSSSRAIQLQQGTPSSSSSSIQIRQEKQQKKKKRIIQQDNQVQQENSNQQQDDMINPDVVPQGIMQLIQDTHKNMRRMMKINKQREKRKLYVEKRKLALCRARELELQAKLVHTLIESGFSKEEISRVINK